MPVTIVTRRENHLRPKEIGRITCQHCGSDLQAERGDFTRVKGIGPWTEATHTPWLLCPVCEVTLEEPSFTWTTFDAALEERAKELHARSQGNLHNLYTRAWHEITEAERESWRARAR